MGKKYLVVMIIAVLLLAPISPAVQAVKAAEAAGEMTANIRITEYTNEYIRGYVNEPQSIERMIANVTTPNGTIKQFSIYGLNRTTGEFKLYFESQPNGSTVQLLVVYVTENGYEAVQGLSIALDKHEEKAPSVPAVRPMNEKSDMISGYAEPYASINVWKNEQLLAQGSANEQGQFMIPFEKQLIGTILSVRAVNKNGTSAAATIRVREEATEKTLSLEIDPIYEEEKDLYIRTEANATIEVRKNYEIIDIIEPHEHSGAQYWAAYSYLDKDDEIFIRAYDSEGNSSEPVIQKVRDNIKPYMLNLKKVTDAAGALHVLSEPETKIEISQNGRLLGQGITNAIGLFAYTLQPIPAASEQITVQAVDKAGNTSKLEIQIVDVTPPAAPVLMAAVYTSTAQIKGTSELGTKVSMKKNGTVYKTANVYQDGVFQFDVSGLKPNDELELTAEDRAGHVSEPLLIKVMEPPVPAAPVIHAVTNISVQITGTSESNALLQLYKEGQLVTTVTSANDGSFVLSITPQKEGTELTVIAVKEGKASEAVKTVVKDVIAPKIVTVNDITGSDTKVTGITEPNAAVTVTIAGKTYEAKADGAGMYNVTIPVQSIGTSLLITATDSAGNVSEAKTVVVKGTVQAFADVSMYEHEIMYLTNKGIIKGYENVYFQPKASIKRLQAIQMILREKGITDLSAPNPNFTDIKPGDYGYEEVAKAVELGIISGKEDAKTKQKYFDPWGTLTRGQMAKILALAYHMEGTYNGSFADIRQSDWVYPYVSVLAANNITTGYSDRTFRANDNISRQHFALFLARYLNPDFRP